MPDGLLEHSMLGFANHLKIFLLEAITIRLEAIANFLRRLI